MLHPTKLAEYLARAGWTQAEFARRSGVHRSILTRYVSGQRRPGRDYSLAIEQATGGEVPASYWASMKPRRRQKAQTPPARRPVPRPHCT